MQIGLSYSPLRLSRHRISGWFLDDNNTQYSIGESACDKSEPPRVFTWNSARENLHKIHALRVLFTNIICIYIKLYTSHRHNISQQAPPRGTSARNCVSYFIIILVSPQWFMASLYANIILYHSSGAATAAAPLAFFRKKKYTYYILCICE